MTDLIPTPTITIYQALRDFRSPMQLRKKIKQNCSKINITEGLRNVGGKASARVVRVTRWVFNVNFTKLVIPLLVIAFLSALHPHTEIQIGVVAGICMFSFVFFLSTKDISLRNSLQVSETNLLSVEVNVVDTDSNQKAITEAKLSSPSFVFFLYQLLPLSLISIMWGWVASLPLPPPLATASIRLFASLAQCDVTEAEHTDLSQYKTISHFFTRKLKPGLRPVCSLSPVVSPADGSLTFSGPVQGEYLEQVKGVRYSLNTFLGPLPMSTSRSLYQMVVYLSPSDYHRFHSPAEWTVTSRRHFPGSLCSVNPMFVRRFPGLFHTNERVVFLGHWAHGFFAMAAVGATNVGSIVVDFDADLKTNKRVTTQEYKHEIEYEKPISFLKGEDFGYFNFGSTIVLLFEAPTNCGLVEMEAVRRVRVGEPLLR